MKTSEKNNNSDTFLAKWLEDELTDNELKDLVSEADYVLYLKLRKGLAVSEKLNASTDVSFAKIQERIENKKVKVRPLYTNWAIGIAASIVVLFGLFTFLNNNDIVVETGFGERREIVLLDGSEVILNSKSKITYDESSWKGERTLNLEGEAYFKVAKGKTFTVSTDNGSVTVLGTQFNVISKGDFFDVVCYEGKVGVKTTESDFILLPNNAVRKVSGRAKTLKNPDKMPTWIIGESTFISVPLKHIITALEDEYEVRFDIESIDNSELFTGSFPHDSLNIALKTVFGPLNISYNEKEKRNIKLRYKK